MQLLKSQERPFSFYGKALAKEEAAKKYKAPTAKDFQKPFKANPIPKSSLEVCCMAEIHGWLSHWCCLCIYPVLSCIMPCAHTHTFTHTAGQRITVHCQRWHKSFLLAQPFLWDLYLQ